MKKIFVIILFLSLVGISYGQFDRDTLTSRTDSISVFNSPKTVGEVTYIEVTIKDVNNSVVDSFAVEKYDYYNAGWHRIGAKNIKTWNNEYQLAPGDGQTKTWTILSFCENPNYIRVRRLNVGATGIKSMVTWEGHGKCN